ncbi:MAG: precorrin-2 C(20)-methyltransferase [Candidatus Methanospirareceae archaeon]
MKKLYGVGVGPGDPDLLTIKAYKILKEVDMIIAPRSSEKRKSLALFTVEKILKERKNKPTVVEPIFPMTKNEEKLELYWRRAREEVLKKAKGRESAAFVTLGDPAFYSTFYKFLDIFKGYVEEVEVIPGITSFSACSSIAKKPIAEGEEIVTIITELNEKAEAMIKNSDSIIFLKPKKVERIKELIGNGEGISCVKIGFEEERMEIMSVEDLKTPKDYLSTLIVRRGRR